MAPGTMHWYRGFRLSSGDFRVVLVTSIAGQGIGARELEGPIPSWYPLPSPT